MAKLLTYGTRSRRPGLRNTKERAWSAPFGLVQYPTSVSSHRRRQTNEVERIRIDQSTRRWHPGPTGVPSVVFLCLMQIRNRRRTRCGYRPGLLTFCPRMERMPRLCGRPGCLSNAVAFVRAIGGSRFVQQGRSAVARLVLEPDGVERLPLLALPSTLNHRFMVSVTHSRRS